MFRQVFLEEVQQGCNKSSKLWSCFLFVTIFLFSVPPLTQAQDPGIPDTVRIECDSLIVGQSRPVTLTVINDESIRTISLGLIISSIDSGYARFDSMVFINRMADPSVLDLRLVIPLDSNGMPPDSMKIGLFQVAGNTLDSGNGPIGLIFMTGLKAGRIAMDSGLILPSVKPLFVLPGGDNFMPQFVTIPIQIVEGTALPELSVSKSVHRDVAGSIFEFTIGASSPAGFHVTVEIGEFSKYDNRNVSPSINPLLNFNDIDSLYYFEWQSSATSVGIWRTTIIVCDSIGNCTEEEILLQVVENSSYLVGFVGTESPVSIFATVSDFENFDEDLEPEIVSSGMGDLASSYFTLHDQTESGGTFVEFFSEDPAPPNRLPRRGLDIGFIDDDEYLDIIQFTAISGQKNILVYHGDGQNGFSLPVTSNVSTDWASIGTLGNFNSDAYLDYVTSGQFKVSIYSGRAFSDFSLMTDFVVNDSILSLSSADFNNDGYDDLAIGTRTSVQFYLGSGSGSFDLKSTYSQLYGSVNIEVTNQGSDFDGDGIYDLCIATPSVGDTSSELIVYLGHGDGTFEQRIVRTVLGQIVANMPADFNGDGLLDIAYLNSSHKYLALIYGDGNGNFKNELRFDVPKYDPHRLICTDFDLDGDIDIAVVSFNLTQGSSIFYYENQSNPAGFSASSITIQGEDNAQLELISPSNKILNRVSSTIPTGSYYRRDLNQNNILDDYASMSLTENGNYILSVKPEPTQPTSTPFTVEFTVNGKLYRLAKDATMSETGYNFNLNFGNGSGYAPKSGSFIYINPPLFVWPNKSEVRFQLATDLAFAAVIIDTIIATSLFQPAEALSISDTTTFYWRIRPTGDTEYSSLHAFNLVPSGPGCGDFDGLAGPINVLDLTYLVDYMFRGGAVPPDMKLADLTNDGNVGILDLTFMVDFIFRGGPPPPC